MFVVLGLLLNPEALLDVWMEGLLVAVVLTLVARPLAVAPMLALFGFNAREITLVSWVGLRGSIPIILTRSEEHTSELQSRPHLVCRLLLEKKKQKRNNHKHEHNT